MAPCSPRFTTSAVGPSARIVRAARITLNVCANCRASPSLIDTTCARDITSVTASRSCSSQKFMLSMATSVGVRTCRSTSSWIAGWMFARKTNGASRSASGTTGRHSPNTPRSVFRVSAVLMS